MRWRRFRRKVILLLIVIVVVAVSINLYLLQLHSQNTNETFHRYNLEDHLKQLLLPPLTDVLHIPAEYREVWDHVAWLTDRAVSAVDLSRILAAASIAPIVKADIGHKGTQLKMTLTFVGGQKAVFKPMRYPRDRVLNDTPYAGADRHNGEIAAFHLCRLLGLWRSPFVVGRRLQLEEEILPVSSPTLRDTFFTENGSMCFYGVCYYCHRGDPACASESGILEGAVILWLPETWKLVSYPHPWRRVYQKGKKARWEVDDSYCNRVRKSSLYATGNRLLDLVDASILDFLVGNADRHHYEVYDDGRDARVLLLDNGKSFGDPHHDEITILAPLYHCCMWRETTWYTLQMFRGTFLSNAMRRLLAWDPLVPVLTEPHLMALDRRIRIIQGVVNDCIRRIE